MDEAEEIRGPGGESLAPGDRVGPFEVERLIGRGGMGEVYLARDVKLGRKVALKLIRGRAFPDKDAVERFLNEARITARFSHPHIVTAYSFGEHGGVPYVALEYLEGESLRERLERGVLPVDEAIRSGRHIAEALAVAHEAGVLHRDLKPDNVLLPKDGRLRVVDFGLAKSLTQPEVELAVSATRTTARALGSPASGGPLAQSQGLTGTPFYMAPEQWTEGPVSEATDVWALGVMLYEMVKGRRPFDGQTIFVLCGVVCSPMPAPSLADRDGVPEPLAAVVARCLAKDPGERPKASEVAAALAALADPTRTMPVRRAPRRGRLALLVVAAAAAAAIAALVVVRLAGPGQGGHADGGGRPDGGGLASLFPGRMPSARPLLRMGVADLSTIRGSEVAPGVFWGLLHREPEGDDVAFLATARPSPDGRGVRALEAGGLEVTWRLREGLRWSDGHPLVAEDVVFGLRVDGDPHVVEATAPDPRTVVVVWDDVTVAALDSIRPLPRHVLGPVFERGGDEAVLEALRSSPTPSCGPYRVVEFETDRRLVLEANPHFAGPPPSIARVAVETASPDVMLRRFEAGTLDLIAPDVLSVEEARDLLARRPEAVHIRPASAQIFLQPDMSVPALAAVEVRRALLMGIDREELVRSLYGAEGQVSHAPAAGELSAGLVRYDFSPQAAGAALAAAGLTRAPLVLSHGPSEGDRAMAEMIGEDLGALGLRVERRELSASDRNRALRTDRHGGLLLASTRVFDGSDLLGAWNVPRRDGHPDLAYRDDAFDGWVAALFERESGALYPERRAQLREAILVAYSERLPQLPLVVPAERVVVDPHLRGWDLRPGDRFGRGLERWYFAR